MRTHHRHPDEPDRPRCGTAGVPASRFVAEIETPSCARCAAAEPLRARRFSRVRQALEDAVAAAGWLHDADGGAVELARVLADQIDGVLFTDDPTAVSRQLAGLYRSLGLTPDGRPEHLTRPAGSVSPLTMLRGGDGEALDDVEP